MNSQKAIRLNEKDNVLVLPFGGAKGDSASSVALAGDVPPGHKIAAAAIKQGAPVVKYGHVIGRAKRDVAAGEWVHEHNVETQLGTAGEEFPPRWEKRPRLSEQTLVSKTYVFEGYRRAVGRPGVRNELWVIPTVGCINGELRAIVRGYHAPQWIDDVKVLEHPYGCSQLGDDLENTKKALAGLAMNPNAAGALIVGLGCENLQIASLLDEIEDKTKIRTLVMQDEDAARIPQLLDELANNAPSVHEAFPLSDLCVGVKCGGSDGFSGLTANPLVGRFADFLTAHGGTVLATELPEMFGAEEEIASRIRSKEVFDDFIAMDRWFRDFFVRCGQPIYENPSPGNREGGITTLEEKSLGAVEKSGHSPVTHVLHYGEPAKADGGVQIAFAPGNDLVSCTSLAASGAQIILFTTGRGTPFGTVVPTIKISTNTPLFEKHRDWIDFDAGELLYGKTWEDETQRLVDHVVATASGKKTAHEKKGHGEIAIFKDGVTL